MMGRFISNWNNTLLRHAKGHRHRSTKSHGIEINDFKLLEEHVHRITVKKATPDWLPFLPGSSFWVPPPPSPFLRKLTISSSQESHKQFGTQPRVQVSLQFNLLSLPQNLPLSEDEEG